MRLSAWECRDIITIDYLSQIVRFKKKQRLVKLSYVVVYYKVCLAFESPAPFCVIWLLLTNKEPLCCVRQAGI